MCPCTKELFRCGLTIITRYNSATRITPATIFTIALDGISHTRITKNTISIPTTIPLQQTHLPPLLTALQLLKLVKRLLSSLARVTITMTFVIYYNLLFRKLVLLLLLLLKVRLLLYTTTYYFEN